MSLRATTGRMTGEDKRKERNRNSFEKIFKSLSYREREILKLRYGIGDGYLYTLEEVGRIFKLTRQRIHQVEARAIRKLQHPVRARRLKASGLLAGYARLTMSKGMGDLSRKIAIGCTLLTPAQKAVWSDWR